MSPLFIFHNSSNGMLTSRQEVTIILVELQQNFLYDIEKGCETL